MGGGGLCPGGSPWQGPSDRDPPDRHPLDRDPRTKTPRQRPKHPPWTDKHLWKHNLRKLCCRAVIMGCTVLSGHIHGCYLVNFLPGMKSSIMGCVPIFTARKQSSQRLCFHRCLSTGGGESASRGRGVCIQGEGDLHPGGSASRGRVSCQSKVDQKCTCSWSRICW